MSQLTLVRHGETEWNREGRIQGSTDIPLNDTGRAQARAAGDALRERLGDRPVRVVSSDLSRAAETADIIAARLGAPAVDRYPGLRERGYGEAEGMDVVQFRDRWPHTAGVDVPGAEPWPDVRARALAALAQIAADVAASGAPDDVEIVAVAHGALIRQVILHASDEQLPREGERIANGAAHALTLRDGALRLRDAVDAVDAPV